MDLLTVAQMAQADALTAARGTAGVVLMDRAGQAVADAVSAHWSVRPVLVLCGPGNNGGDGFVAARYLAERGWPVLVALLGSVDALKGDAANACQRWLGARQSLGMASQDAIAALDQVSLDGVGLVIDALFGAGLARPLDAQCVATLQAVKARALPVVAVDVPSGVWGDTGGADGAIAADVTVTFFSKKPAHLLYPGRALCGQIVVADIGIDAGVLPDLHITTFENEPGGWLREWPRLEEDGHKYSRGHALVVGGVAMTGAARLAAKGAARIGAGLTTVAAPEPAWPIYAASLDCIMVHGLDGVDDAAWASSLGALLNDARFSGLLIGPGAGLGAKASALTLLRSGRPVVLDADALTCFAADPGELFEAIQQAKASVVLTPHMGEFQRLFSQIDSGGSKLDRARAAAALSGAVVLLKGPDTVIAAPDGRAAINANAPAWLGTAGAGDVLAGLITGLLAQGMPAWQAACAAVWVHGEAARQFGLGLIADDLPLQVPAVLRQLDALRGMNAR